MGEHFIHHAGCSLRTVFVAATAVPLLVASFANLVAAQTETKLTASDAAESDFFGVSVSLHGQRIAVGTGAHKEAAYVYDFDGTGWQETRITPSLSVSGDYFGGSVSVDGDRLVVAATGNDSKGEDSGAVYVFDFDGSSWVETTKITAGDGKPSLRFGSAVSLDGNRLAVGAPSDDVNGAGSGSTYIFDFDGQAWAETAKLTPSNGTESDFFGSSVSLDGNLLVVGAPSDDLSSLSAGNAYGYSFDGNNWTESRLVPSAGDSLFGRSLAVEGNSVVVGAPGSSVGAAYVYSFVGGSFVETQRISAVDAGTYDFFGASVSIGQGHLAVGASLDDDNGVNSGSVYIFKFDGNSWSKAGQLLPTDGESADNFGNSVSLDGTRLVVGAKFDHDKEIGSGSAYVYDDLTAVAIDDGVPKSSFVRLGPNAPNPVTGHTSFTLTVDEPVTVRVTVYDLLGRPVGTIADRGDMTGERRLTFDASALAPGVYFYRLEAGDYSETRSMVVVK